MSTHVDVRKGFAGVLLLAVFGLVGTMPADLDAQETDARWLPFVGCWEAVGGTEEGGLVCFQPADDDLGVEMLTVADGAVTAREVLRADGPRPFDRDGCTGQERLRFSDDATRIYTEADFVCEGGVRRSTSGIMSMTAPTQWLDVKSVDMNGENVAFVQFYELAPRSQISEAGLEGIGADRVLAIDAARMAASAPIDLADVEDAVEHADAKAVEAWIAERGEPFDLDGDVILRLADSGVPDNVIDVVVAVSYPGKFVLGDERPTERLAAEGYDRVIYGGFPYGRYYDPYFMDPFYRRGIGFGFGYYGYGYGYPYYSPYGYYGYTPRVIVVDTRSRSRGRAVQGRGYTRGSSGSAGPRRAIPTGRSIIAPSGGSSRGSVSPPSSGSSRGTARKAKPRRRGG